MANQKSIKAELQHQLKIQGKNNPTYKSQVNQYCKWLQEEGKKKATIEEARDNLQKYLDTLKTREGKRASADTVHTACAAVCASLRVSMENYTIPQRGMPTKGRDVSDRVINELNERVVEFAKMVGIREKEYGRLRGDNLVERNGNLYVVVERGKGGKYQEQYIRPEHHERVKEYFNGSRERIFAPREIKACEHANLHSYRRENAQEAYREFLRMDREQVKELVREQFMREHDRRVELYGHDKFKLDKKLEKLERQYDRPYYCKNEYREARLKKGEPVQYDRLALIATSCLCLSHWRVNVCVKNYMK